MTGEPRVSIVGAGLMGAGIAQVFVAAGLEVSIYDPAPSALASAPDRVRAGLELLDPERDSGEALRRLALNTDLAALVEGADLVIEAGPERVEVKRAIFADLDRLAPASAVLTSNTSAIPIKEIARDCEQPERVIGTHFWNPPALVPLVEVVQSEASEPTLVEWTIRLLGQVGMKPVHVRSDTPGFVGNRMQHALKREAIALVAEGVCDAETVDVVARFGFGARLGILGPLEQSDLVGLGLLLDIHKTLMPALNRTAVPHPYLVEKVRRGETGAAVGHGFREWTPEEAAARQAEVTRELVAAARRRREAEAQQ
ncbi:MAG TPA: 3-hydroxyacyl-CoA dehydrogenase NAD-binding domain-containing protein [Actinomycetota bacterium]